MVRSLAGFTTAGPWALLPGGTCLLAAAVVGRTLRYSDRVRSGYVDISSGEPFHGGPHLILWQQSLYGLFAGPDALLDQGSTLCSPGPSREIPASNYLHPGRRSQESNRLSARWKNLALRSLSLLPCMWRYSRPQQSHLRPRRCAKQAKVLFSQYRLTPSLPSIRCGRSLVFQEFRCWMLRLAAAGMSLRRMLAEPGVPLGAASVALLLILRGGRQAPPSTERSLCFKSGSLFGRSPSSLANCGRLVDAAILASCTSRLSPSLRKNCRASSGCAGKIIDDHSSRRAVSSAALKPMLRALHFLIHLCLDEQTVPPAPFPVAQSLRNCGAFSPSLSLCPVLSALTELLFFLLLPRHLLHSVAGTSAARSSSFPSATSRLRFEFRENFRSFSCKVVRLGSYAQARPPRLPLLLLRLCQSATFGAVSRVFAQVVHACLPFAG